MSLYDRDETPVKISFTLPRYMLDGLDEYAEAAKTSRSELIRRIIQSDLMHVDLDDVRWFANASPSKYENVWDVAKRLAKENKAEAVEICAECETSLCALNCARANADNSNAR